MAIQLRDIQNKSPQVSVEGEIQFEPSEVQDETNAMIVGPAEKGPFFIPTTLRTKDQFDAIFGGPTTYSSYSARKVLEQTDRVKFTRIISTDGWNPEPIALFASGGEDFPHFEEGTGAPLAVLIFDDKYQRVEGAVPEKTEISQATANQNRVAEDFILRTFDEMGDLVDEWRLSLNPFSPRYIERIVPPKLRVYQNFRETQRSVVADADGEVLVNLVTFENEAATDPLRFESFDSPRTPWIISQENPPGERSRLFRIWVRSGGASENQRFKVSLVDIGLGESESGWPTFTLRLRDFDDTDLNQEVIEEYDDLSLNPQDERFIGKAIGTEFKKYNRSEERIETFGAFEKQSLNIRVELSEELGKASKETLPFGFESYKETFAGSSQVPIYRTDFSFPGRLLEYLNANEPASQKGRTIQENLHLGIEFRAQQNKNFFQAIPEAASGVDEGFKLDNYLDSSDSNPKERKLSLGFQGGSDGQSIYREQFSGEDIRRSNTFGFDFSDRFSGGQDAYERAFFLLREDEGGFDFNLLTTPELDFQNHERIIREGEKLMRNRLDSFYVFDGFEIGTTPQEAVEKTFQLDSTHTATYYGWVNPIEDINFEFVPPSAIIPQTYSQSDVIGDPWIAPAGVRRGEVPGIEDVEVRLGREDLDLLYENSINAITFSDANGILLLGNRTLTSNLDSSLSSIDVRRTLVFVISEVKRISENFLFEQINEETAQRYRASINRLLVEVQSRNGIREYEVDVSVPRQRSRFERRPNTIAASVSLIPQPSAEYITVDFRINEEGVNVTT